LVDFRDPEPPPGFGFPPFGWTASGAALSLLVDPPNFPERSAMFHPPSFRESSRKEPIYMTRVKFMGLSASLLALAAVVIPARAAEQAQSAKAYVVLVGVSNYADKQIKPRPHAEDDAKALYDLFTAKEYLGVGKDHIRLLLGGDADATRNSAPATKENILKAAKWLETEAKPEDLVIFTFIGQGGTLGEKGDRLCYFASDSSVKERDKNAVAAAEIGQELDKLKSQHFCVFLDVNFKGFTLEKGSAPEPVLGEAPFREFLGDDGTEDHLAVTGRALFLATNGLSQSLDLEKHGLFTEVLLDGLKGKADVEGYEPDGIVTVDELTVYMNKELPKLAANAGKTKEEREQVHFVLGGRGSRFVLTHNPAVAAKVKERLEKFWDLARKNDQLGGKIAEEGKAYLGRMPRLEAQRSIRKQYQQLVGGAITAEKFLEEREKILDSTKLPRDSAEAFAKKVYDVAHLMKTSYVKVHSEGELINWGIRGLYRSIDEKIPDELRTQLDKVKNLDQDELKALLADARQQLGKREDLDNHKDIDYALKRMLSHLDPYTTYIDPETLDRFREQTGGKFVGVGIQIRKDIATDMLQVISPILGSPSYKAGIQEGDLITEIIRVTDDKGKALDQPEVISTKGLLINDAVKKIKGLPKTKVKLMIQRDTVDKPFEVELTRTLIETESVLGVKRKADDSWDYWIDPENKIGYIRLTQFQENSYDDMKKAMKDLINQGVKGFVLDLRFNPGGLLDSACEISDLFIDDGLIVTIRPRVGREQPIRGHHEGSLLDFPMVCMVNGMSASASEIVSACLQDHHRAIVLGERSYGKGSVQTIQRFDGGQLKFTNATYWRPSGKNINKPATNGKEDEEWGVTPDKGFVVEMSHKERDDLGEYQRNLEIIPRKDKQTKDPKADFKDRQLDKALDYLRDQIKTASRVPAKKAG
jgi:C-terminal peptidase prc